MNKTVAVMMMILFLVGSLSLVFDIQPAKAQPKTIRVPCDYPTIQAAINAANPGDTIFVFNGTYHENIVVDRSVSLVGENKSTTIIDGSGLGSVIYIEGINNSRIAGFTVQNGLNLDEGSGMYLRYSSNNIIDGNVIVSNGIGIYVRYDSNNNTIMGNEIRNNGAGITLYYSSNNDLTQNRMVGNFHNLAIEGLYLSHFSHNIDASNTINDKPVRYLVNQKDLQIDNSTFPDIGYLGLVNSTNITVRNLSLANNNGEEALFAFTADSHIEGMNISTHGIGISMVGSNNNTVINNTLSPCGGGIYLDQSGYNFISNNTVACIQIGISIAHNMGNIIRNNNVEGNLIGIQLASTNESQIIDNVIASNAQDGIYIITSCENSTIFHNNFINNTRQVFSIDSVTLWNYGYPCGGNYWDDYAGVDTNSDGIGDTSYIIDADNQDRYPLMHPWSPLPVHNINTGLGYATIQEAINTNETLHGHTIFAEAGTYYENVVVNKTLSLIGENRDITIIDGGSVGEGVTVQVIANSVVFRCFTTKASGLYSINILLNKTTNNLVTSNNMMGGDPFISGVKVHASTNATLTGNNITGSGPSVVVSESSYVFVSENNIAPPDDTYVSTGVGLLRSSNCIVTGNNLTSITSSAILLSESFNNTVTGNNIIGYEHPSLGISGTGIRIGHDPGENASSYNSFYDNNIKSTYYAIAAGIFVGEGGHHGNIFLRNNVENNYYGLFWHNSSNNVFYHNNFMNNTIQVYNKDAVNVWDNGYPSGGNYWSNYTGVDLDPDGIGDSWYEIDSSNIDHYPLMGMFSDFDATSEHSVQTICNSSISGFQYGDSSIRFNVAGEDGTAGFCRICIPTALMNATYRVFVNGTEVQCNLLPCSNSTHSYLYFSYSHSIKEIVIIPELASLIILPLFMLATLIVVIICNKKRIDIT